jgi:hypothetical protein
MGLIEDADVWLEIRELRNVAIYDYNETSLSKLYQRLGQLCPTLLDLKTVINKCAMTPDSILVHRFQIQT